METSGVRLNRDKAVAIEHRDASSALMLRGLLLKSADFVLFYKKVGESLHHMDTEASYILLHEKPIKIEDDPYVGAGNSMRLVMLPLSRR